jgi:hypothetical protein
MFLGNANQQRLNEGGFAASRDADDRGPLSSSGHVILIQPVDAGTNAGTEASTVEMDKVIGDILPGKDAFDGTRLGRADTFSKLLCSMLNQYIVGIFTSFWPGDAPAAFRP